MPFIGQDWRSRGETWEKTSEGSWERTKLRPLVHTEPISIPGCDRPSSSSSEDENSPATFSPPKPSELPLAQPHCFVKTGNSKEFVGCTSLSEAFHKLDMVRAVSDVRRFNYVCKVVSILVREKLENLSGSGRRVVLGVVEALVRGSLDRYGEVTTVRELVGDLAEGLEGGIHVGSPKVLHSQAESASSLHRLISTSRPAAPLEASGESVTLVDLPRECLRAVLRRLPDHLALLSAADALDQLMVQENGLWRGLAHFHFTPAQIAALPPSPPPDPATPAWRHTFFQLKKWHGLKEAYADMIHICCYCKALHWKDLGHPCISNEDPPSVRVTPQQFVLMLMFL